MARSSTPLIVAFCPNSPSSMANPEVCTLFSAIEQQIIAALDPIPNLYVVRPDEFRKYPADPMHDAERDQLGHIPYTSLFYAAPRNGFGSQDSCAYELAL